MSTLRLCLANRVGELPRVSEALARFTVHQDLPAVVRFDLELVIEELLLNVIRYGYDDPAPHRIALEVRYEDGLLSVQISDDGRPFNPLDVPAPNLEAPLEQRPLGGLGIYLVRKIMDSLCYRRENDKNHLRLQKRIRG